MGLTRLQFYEALGAEISVVEPILVRAYEREAELEWRGGSNDSPHGSRWSTAFHSSSFPGEDPFACGRLALYGLMDVPDERPREPFLSQWFDLGTQIEHNQVRRFAQDGVLLSRSPAVGDDYQTVFVDAEHWLTGAADAIILPPFWRKGHNVELKSTSAEKISAMRANREDTPSSHAKYVRQLKTYIGLAYEQEFAPKVVVCSESWAITAEFPMGMRFCPVHQSFDCGTEEVQLEPPTDGTLIYFSRDPERGLNLDCVSYYVEHDPEHMRVGREKLVEWRDYFLRGEIPPHPHEGQRAKWSVSPCQWCSMKGRVCKPDYTGKVGLLADSHAIAFTQGIREGYDYAAQRASVFARWEETDPLRAQGVAA